MTLPIYGQPGAPSITGPGPVNPPPPEFYPMSFDQLETLQRVPTRAVFALSLLCQPPDFDPTWPLQDWFDPTADPAQPYEYLAIATAPGGAFVFNPYSIKSVTIPGKRAVMGNWPGRAAYPVWNPPQTNATTDGQNLVEVQVLSTEAQATALAAQFPGSVVVQGNSLQPPVDNQGRSDWMLHGGGLSSDEYVGTLLAVQYAKGVGVPGEWIVSNGGAIWVPTPQAADGITSGIPTSFVPRPVRALLSNEVLRSAGMFGGMVFSR